MIISLMSTVYAMPPNDSYKGQPWFTKDIRQVRREFHRAESEWLRCVQRSVQKKRIEAEIRTEKKGV